MTGCAAGLSSVWPYIIPSVYMEGHKHSASLQPSLGTAMPLGIGSQVTFSQYLGDTLLECILASNIDDAMSAVDLMFVPLSLTYFMCTVFFFMAAFRSIYP